MQVHESDKNAHLSVLVFRFRSFWWDLDPDVSRFGSFRAAANLAGNRHRLQDARDDLTRTRAVHLVNGPGFEQFRVSQDDPQLVGQPVKQLAQFRVSLRGPWALVLTTGNVYIHACWPAGTEFPGVCRASLGSRHSESAKIRIDPPAVRTYSTFPAEIQL